MPVKVVNSVRSKINHNKIRARKSYDEFKEEEFENLLTNILSLKEGDNIFLHSSLDYLHLSFDPNRLLQMLIEKVGTSGTIVMPSFSGLSYDFLKTGRTFNLNRTPSQSGLLSELFRRKKDTVRSLHPTKSVVALGPLAEYLTNSHHEEIYPFGSKSPFYKSIQKDFFVIGFGVSTTKLSLVHCVEDILGSDFPVKVWHDEKFKSKCIDKDGKMLEVLTVAHRMWKMNHNIPKYIRQYIDDNIDFKYLGRDFYKVSSRRLYDNLNTNALIGKTIYPRYSYKFSKMFR